MRAKRSVSWQACIDGECLSTTADEGADNEYDYDKYRVENDVENFPENAADWTGRKVGEVEAIPQDIEYGVDRFVSA